MLTIESLENFLWETFGESYIVRTETETFNIQNLGPMLADFLHAHGVVIDWSDGSRYNTKMS